MCEIISQINQIANYAGRGRDDLDHSILLETEGLLRRITKDQSKAIRILGKNQRFLYRFENSLQEIRQEH